MRRNIRAMTSEPISGSEETIIRMIDSARIEAAVVRRIILEQFLAARQNTAERVSEPFVNRMTCGRTISSYDSDGMLLVEDIFMDCALEVRS